MTLAERCYEAATLLPDSEKFGLALQVRRAAVSIAANIAEGHQLPTASYRHHVSIVLGSVAELQTHVELARRLKFLSAEAAGHLQRQLSDVRSMLVRLRSALVRNSR